LKNFLALWKSFASFFAMKNTQTMSARKKKLKPRSWDNDPFGINSGPKWGTPEHAAAEAAFHAELDAENMARFGVKYIPAMPIISDAEFNRLQSLAAKYR
jgi:hypothetical protein